MKSIAKLMYFLCSIFTCIGLWLLFAYKNDQISELNNKLGIEFNRLLIYSLPAQSFFILALICAVIATGLVITNAINCNREDIISGIKLKGHEDVNNSTIDIKKSKPEYYDGVDNDALNRYFSHKK